MPRPFVAMLHLLLAIHCPFVATLHHVAWKRRLVALAGVTQKRLEIRADRSVEHGFRGTPGLIGRRETGHATLPSPGTCQSLGEAFRGFSRRRPVPSRKRGWPGTGFAEVELDKLTRLKWDGRTPLGDPRTNPAMKSLQARVEFFFLF
jgi:hypothetical protein